MAFSLTLDKILQRFIEECESRNLELDREFAAHIVHLLAMDSRIGIDPQKMSECKTQKLLQDIIDMYADPCDPIMASIKLTYRFKHAPEMSEEFVKEKYKMIFDSKLNVLISDILQYPETSNAKQIDQMFKKIQIFVLASYQLGCPHDHVLIKAARKALDSVIGRGDLQNFLLKKYHQREAYLRRLSATVAGILIYNNQGPSGDKEHFRDICSDLAMAQKNTQQNLNDALGRATHCRTSGITVTKRFIHIDWKVMKVMSWWPLEKVQEINKFTVLFHLFERFMQQILDAFNKVEYLISLDLKKMQCTIERINDILKIRTAIESEQIFPHFVYLSELWSSLVQHLNHIAEINRVQDALTAYVPNEIETKFVKVIHTALMASSQANNLDDHTFGALIDNINRKPGKCALQTIHPDPTSMYCCLTIALTNGLLVPATLQKKLCENLPLTFGFNHIDLAKYAERHFEEFMRTFGKAIFNSVPMMLLFDVEYEAFKLNYVMDKAAQQQQAKVDNSTQTEMIVDNDLTVRNRINATWNIWDFHRETIRVANLRQRQTHSAQTDLSYGKRNAQNQTYNTRKHLGI